MLSATGVRQQLTGAVVGFAVIVIAPVTPSAPRAQAFGLLTGTVTDSAKAPLPGVKVTVVTASVERTAGTGPDGRYQFPNLLPGTYAATAEMPGFETAVEKRVVVETGATTLLHFALEIDCLLEALRVDIGLARSVEEATAIVQIRISDSGSGERCLATGFCVCTEHVADVIRIVKVGQGEVSPATIRFLQEGAGRNAENVAGAEKPYAPGQEYVAFLRWDSASDRFLRFNGPIYMFPIRDGRVEVRRTDAAGISDGMPIEEFTRALRGLVSPARRVGQSNIDDDSVATSREQPGGELPPRGARDDRDVEGAYPDEHQEADPDGDGMHAAVGYAVVDRAQRQKYEKAGGKDHPCVRLEQRPVPDHMGDGCRAQSAEHREQHQPLVHVRTMTKEECCADECGERRKEEEQTGQRRRIGRRTWRGEAADISAQIEASSSLREDGKTADNDKGQREQRAENAHPAVHVSASGRHQRRLRQEHEQPRHTQQGMKRDEWRQRKRDVAAGRIDNRRRERGNIQQDHHQPDADVEPAFDPYHASARR